MRARELAKGVVDIIWRSRIDPYEFKAGSLSLGKRVFLYNGIFRTVRIDEHAEARETWHDGPEEDQMPGIGVVGRTCEPRNVAARPRQTGRITGRHRIDRIAHHPRHRTRRVPHGLHRGPRAQK